MERIVKITPAFDKRSEGSGIGCAQMFMVLKGELGAVVFSMRTGWYHPDTEDWKRHWRKIEPTSTSWDGAGNAVSYCSYKPLGGYEEPRNDCNWLGCTCYGDTSYTLSDDVFRILVTDGSEAVWEWLEKWYNKTFNIIS